MPTTKKSILDGTESTSDRGVEIERPDYDFFGTPINKSEVSPLVFSIKEKKTLHPDTRELNSTLESLYKELSANGSTNYDDVCKRFYRIQSMHELGKATDVVQIGVYIETLNNSWKSCIKTSIEEINEAAPGIYLFETSSIDIADIIVNSSYEKSCYTAGSIFSKETGEIVLSNDWKGDWQSTSTHELLHALGFQHEMKRMYANLYVNLSDKIDKEWKSQYVCSDEYIGLCRFDPLSIMMYPETDDMQRKYPGDPVWRHKLDKARSNVMSELDKVGLNLLFRPCRQATYDPKVSVKNDMLYCGRKTTMTHNYPTTRDTDGFCGPNNGPNCPACRVLVIPASSKRQRLHNEGKWQGWSGWFYCGKSTSVRRQYVEHYDRKENLVNEDGICGPNNGNPCNKCGKELFDDYEMHCIYGPKRNIRIVKTRSCVIL